MLSYKYCFCQKVAYTSTDLEMTVFCNTFSQSSTLTYILAIISSIVIVIVNKITGIFNKKLIKFARYKTVSEEANNIMSHNYFTMLINSIIIPMIVAFKFSNFVISTFIYNNSLGLLLGQQSYDLNNYSADIDRQWYVTVGTVMVSAVYYQIFMPFVWLPFGFYSACKRRVKARKAII